MAATATLDTDAKVFLENWQQSDRSTVSNWFHNAVRAGHRTSGAVCDAVRMEADQRARHLALSNYPNHNDHERIRILREQFASNNMTAAERYARYVIAYEALPLAERQKLKSDKGLKFAIAAMESKPASEKQIGFLRSLGYTGAAPTSAAEASRLIEEQKNKGGVR